MRQGIPIEDVYKGLGNEQDLTTSQMAGITSHTGNVNKLAGTIAVTQDKNKFLGILAGIVILLFMLNKYN